MKIVRYTLNICLLAFSVAACTAPEIGNTDVAAVPIQFAAAVNSVTATGTRSADTNDDESEAFIVNNIAALKDKDISLYGIEYANSDTAEFIPGWLATVKEVGSIYVFDYATRQQQKYYKPQDGMKYDFTAIFPPVDSGAGVSKVNKDTLSIELEYRPDFMVAKNRELTKPTGSATVSIPLQFEHQLALVSFYIYKDIESLPPNSSSHNIYLNKMTLAGRTIANFSLSDNTFTDVDGISGATVRVPGYPYSTFLVEADTTKKIRDLFLFPSNGGVQAEQYTFEFTINEGIYKAILPATGKQWEAGKQYIYTMKVVGSDVYIELGGPDSAEWKLKQEEWEDVDDDDIIEGV